MTGLDSSPWTAEGAFVIGSGVPTGRQRPPDGRIAQLVEQLTLNQRVQGSSPCAPTNKIKKLCEMRGYGSTGPNFG